VVPFAPPLVPITTAVVFLVPPYDERLPKPLERCKRSGLGRCLPKDRQDAPVCFRPEPPGRIECLVCVDSDTVCLKEPQSNDRCGLGLDLIDLSPLIVWPHGLRIRRLLYQSRFHRECVHASECQIPIYGP
jgi:hypothetical protein